MEDRAALDGHDVAQPAILDEGLGGSHQGAVGPVMAHDRLGAAAGLVLGAVTPLLAR